MCRTLDRRVLYFFPLTQKVELMNWVEILGIIDDVRNGKISVGLVRRILSVADEILSHYDSVAFSAFPTSEMSVDECLASLEGCHDQEDPDGFEVYAALSELASKLESEATPEAAA